MKYAIISNQKRSILLERVIIDKQSVKTVAQQLKIKFPSAKSIIRTYKNTGTIFNKKKARRTHLKQSEQIKVNEKKKSPTKEEIKTEKNIETQEKSEKIQTPNIQLQKSLQQQIDYTAKTIVNKQNTITYNITVFISFPRPLVVNISAGVLNSYEPRICPLHYILHEAVNYELPCCMESALIKSPQKASIKDCIPRFDFYIG